jgi:IS1 family transposase
LLDRSSIKCYDIAMNKLNTERRSQIVAALVEGNSIRATARMADVSKNTVIKLLCELGMACEAFHNEHARGIASKRVQCDEIWSFCYAKEKNLPRRLKGRKGYGDVWTWVALDADSKFAVSWLLGDRNAKTASAFMEDVAERLRHRVQLTTDGNNTYLEAVEGAFGADVDYAMLVKLYGETPEAEKRYSPPQCTGCRRTAITGNPDPRHVSTSFVERQNLTMRMGMRRFTRLTNAFSKKFENLRAAVALHFVYYNFCRVHQSLRMTPAMAAGVADHLWEIKDIVRLLDSN